MTVREWFRGQRTIDMAVTVDKLLARTPDDYWLTSVGGEFVFIFNVRRWIRLDGLQRTLEADKRRRIYGRLSE